MTGADTLLVERLPRPRRSLWRPKVPIAVVISLVFLAVAVLCVCAPFIAPHDPSFINPAESFRGPSAEHLLGTDQLGRDIVSRIIAGARTAVLAPLLLAAGTVLISTALAVLAGYAGGRVDGVIGRVNDVLYSIPSLTVAIVVVGVTGGGFALSICVLMIFALPANIRLLRAAVLERVHLPYIEAARTLGVSTPRILVTQLVPAISPLIVTSFFLQVTFAIVELSSLSFLGLGVPPGSPDWGRMLAENRSALSSNVWATAGPGLCLVALAVSANLIGDWLYTKYEQAGRSR
ncbi:ABC transporter permease [Acrocarpospora macrocephala]|uniref:ABC transporter permease n=1 Tax=Acrocarpospora macrocephala TaxID=150177 RepID=A0A5M3WZ57_9ACTN|nr:ABC transporter permease [Acrocarpospora macrocephala]GES13179.1 ABC transporter permease [Acrocarpospora macrocephala]